MHQVYLPHPRENVPLDMLLAMCDELLHKWTEGGLGTQAAAMPVYTSKQSLAARLAKDAEYEFSFDVACRLVSAQPNMMQASPEFFDHPSNHPWFEKISAEAGLRRRKGKRSVINCVQFTQACINYWEGLDARHRSDLQERAQALLEADGEEEAPASPDLEVPQAADLAPSTARRRELVVALVNQLQNDDFIPTYRKKKLATVSTTGWDKRLEAYFWPSPAFRYESTHARLAALTRTGSALARALQQNRDWNEAEQAQAIRFAQDIFIWGGVPQDPATVTAENVRAVIRDAINDNRLSTAPMNSGWTKVAALASAYLEDVEGGKPQVIWDSRVAHSLIQRLDALLCEAGLDNARQIFPDIGTVAGRGGTRPSKPTLSWPIGYGRWATQVSGSALVREMRDILNDTARNFPRMPCGGDQTGPWTSRGVEMVLFMDGY